MKKIIFIFGFILLSSCGFKVVNNEQFNKYYIAQINSKGDNKINYRIKNKITTSSNTTNKIAVVINLDTKKTSPSKKKTLKMRLQNTLKINVSGNIKLLNSSELKYFKIIKLAASQSQTDTQIQEITKTN